MPHTRLRYHITTSTKHRMPLITPKVETIVHHVIKEKAMDLNCKIIAIGNTDNHIHMIAAIRYSIALSNFIRAIKASSSLAVRKANLNTEFRWQKSYGAFTMEYDRLDGIIQYVINQKQHHAKKNLWEKYEITR